MQNKNIQIKFLAEKGGKSITECSNDKPCEVVSMSICVQIFISFNVPVKDLVAFFFIY